MEQHYAELAARQQAYRNEVLKELAGCTDPSDRERIDAYLRDPQFCWHPKEAVRFALGPEILHPDIQHYARLMEEATWFAEQVNFKDDKRDWDRLDDGTKHIVRSILGFFQIFDHIVGQNININFMSEINCKDAQHVYIIQADQERIHEKSYDLQPRAICRGQELTDILNAMKNNPIIPKMIDWLSQYMSEAASSVPIGKRLIAFVMVEGVWFSGAFCFLHWLKTKNVLPGITESNEFIRRDEGIHTEFGCKLIRDYLIMKPYYDEMKEIVESATQIADEFINEAIPCRLAGMNADLMSQYIRFQADTVVKMMGYPPVFNVGNPFKFMESFDIHDKKDFFARKPTAYKNETKSTNFEIDYNTLSADLNSIVFY
jgi:ribonucleoside-diphosphate reductase beta chain